MAEISFLHFPEDDHDHDLSLDDFSYWPQNDAVSSFDRKNQVTFVMDLFHQRLEDSTHQFGLNNVNNSGFRVIRENSDLEIELGFVQESSLMGSGEIVLNNGNDSRFRVIDEIHDVGLDDLDLELGFVAQEEGIVSNESGFRVIEENHDVGGDCLEVELGFVGQRRGNGGCNLIGMERIVSNESGFRVIEENHDVGGDCLEVELGFVGQRRGNGGCNLIGTERIVSNESRFRVIEENHDVGGDCLEVELGFVGQGRGNGGCNLIGTERIVSNDSRFRVIEENHDVGVDPLEVELVVGLVDQENGENRHDNDDDDCNFDGFAVSECGDDFYIARRNVNVNENVNVSSVWIESDSEDEVERIGNVMLGMHLHSDEDEEDDFCLDNVNGDGDISLPLCWDSFHLEEEDLTHDFEWEEVDDGADPEDEEGSISVLNISGSEEDAERGNRVSNLEWEVLLNRISVNNLGRNLEMENEVGPYFGDHDDDYIYTTDYDMMFGQFADGENAILGKPPASKSVVENLPSLVITKVDLVDEKSVCAVCKDQIEVGDEGKELPCFHRYHGECITPWLEIRNTCPVCRFELPTDDPDYEERKARRSARVG